MTSITTSPNHPLISAHAIHEGNWSGKKRRPIDPDETGSVGTTLRYDNEVVEPHAKRHRTIDDVLGSLSLRAPDPPGNFSCSKRKSDDGGEDGRSAKLARSGDRIAPSTFGENATFSGGNSAAIQQQMEPTGRRDDSPTNVTLQLFDPSTQQQITSDAGPNNNMDSNEMSIDDSDCESSNSSVSEGSIRNAMYQLVFGRRNPPLLSNGNVGGGHRYDNVDSKVEDMIRRSRLEAAIKSKKKENEKLAADVDMDDMDDGNSDEEDDWLPGHG
mmetsp:Transcript_20127/g.43709  ORF Transcript_20127/g.43709 Transcript_20127/m.43709 type:complete len:271 (+) Transcript_20127:124-936(+)|eukprot:CAMPEP_0172324168 /NCGR_PEP_ID=MMETSP1058-20130122/50638_1 /TAXON_ID=83371 /ORGANISM="Detonula confervacea, Strain CCMP 353" /LENGTH=270 /DNA_ID=CAMNT_0013040367 /DNA_START=60 /DNA_END=872 /DNA_ORIENTATION=-